MAHAQTIRSRTLFHALVHPLTQDLDVRQTSARSSLATMDIVRLRQQDTNAHATLASLAQHVLKSSTYARLIHATMVFAFKMPT